MRFVRENKDDRDILLLANYLHTGGNYAIYEKIKKDVLEIAPDFLDKIANKYRELPDEETISSPALSDYSIDVKEQLQNVFLAHKALIKLVAEFQDVSYKNRHKVQSSKSSDVSEVTEYSWEDIEEDWSSEQNSPKKPISDGEPHSHFGAEEVERMQEQAARIEEGNQLVFALLSYVQAHRLPETKRTEKSNFIISKVKAQCPGALSKITPDMSHDILTKFSQDEKHVLYDIAAQEFSEINAFHSKGDSDDESAATSHESIDSDGPHHKR